MPNQPIRPKKFNRPEEPKGLGEIEEPKKPKKPTKLGEPQELEEPKKPQKLKKLEEPKKPQKPKELGEPKKPLRGRRAMFARMVARSLTRRRSRVAIAISAVAIGATTLFALATIATDIPRQMTREMRAYGGNLLVLPAEGQTAIDQAVLAEVDAVVGAADLVGAAPYRYQTVRLNEQPYLAAGTDLAAVRAVSPYWHVEGDWPARAGEILVGRDIADWIGLEVGANVELVTAAPAEDANASGPVDDAATDATNNPAGTSPTGQADGSGTAGEADGIDAADGGAAEADGSDTADRAGGSGATDEADGGTADGSGATDAADGIDAGDDVEVSAELAGTFTVVG
ncbi:MAG: hypothetical protein LBE08_10510, partial [Bifidobacteriaceae bacterium]|nr:hypothetical protein [Bifidobacteriaceae bacterium]